VRFIDEHRDRFGGVEPICRVLVDNGWQIAPSGYYAFKARHVSARQVRDEQLLADIARVHAGNYGVYGARKMWRALQREGIPVARCTVERLMRQAGLAGAIRGRKVRTTVSDPAGTRAADRVNRDFTAHRPNQTWVADFTYVATWSGIVYVAFVVDVYSRAIVGWSAASNKRTGLVLAALDMGLWRRDRAGQRVSPGLVHHSDAGSQYTSFRFTTHLLTAGIDASVGTVGDALDNALMESTIGLYKTELIKPRGPWHTLAKVELATAEWVDWYNTTRLHQPSGTPHPTTTNPCTTLNTSPVRWFEPTSEVSTEPGRFRWVCHPNGVSPLCPIRCDLAHMNVNVNCSGRWSTAGRRRCARRR
jgi:putative transposase